MATTSLSTRALLSYSQIKEMNPSFSDLMVKDYAGIQADWEATAIVSDGFDGRITLNTLAIAVNVTNIAANAANIVINAANIALNAANIVVNADNILNLEFRTFGIARPDGYDEDLNYVIGDEVVNPATDTQNYFVCTTDTPIPAGAFNPVLWQEISLRSNESRIADATEGVTTNATNIATNASNFDTHNTSNTEHGVSGNSVGTEDFCTILVGGVVLLMELVNDAVDSTQTIVLADIAAAPAVYDQTFTDTMVAMANDTKAKHNQLVTDMNLVVTQLNDLIAKSKTAKQMAII